MTQVLDSLAGLLFHVMRRSNELNDIFDIYLIGLSIALQLNTASMNSPLTSRSMPVAATEVRQGLYKEYTVEKVDDRFKDANTKTYKTADETEDNKTKYWAILGVLLAGSFIIPMVQYYWYVADDDD